MVHPVLSLGFTPNGNVYRKTNANEKTAMALFGTMGVVKAGGDIYKNITKELPQEALSKGVFENLKKGLSTCSKKSLALTALLGAVTIGAELIWGKLIGATIDAYINGRRALDADGAETFLLKQQGAEAENIEQDIQADDIEDSEYAKDVEEDEYELSIDDIVEDTIDEDELILVDDILDEEIETQDSDEETVEADEIDE